MLNAIMRKGRVTLLRRVVAVLAAVAIAIAEPSVALSAAPSAPARPPDTGFLNRQVAVAGRTYKFVVYVPEGWNPAQRWPVILFLHGSGERGSDGMDQTQVGLPSAIRSHPERWPFLVVAPQVPYDHHFWPDPDMMAQAMAALDSASREFHADPDRTYLTGLSLGGFGTWEIAKAYPNRFAALVPICGGIHWDWVAGGRKDPTLAAAYARAIGKTPVWIFHGAEDPVVSPRQSDEMFDALKAAGGNVLYWEFRKIQHGSWDRAYNNPGLPQWLLSKRLSAIPSAAPYAEKIEIPLEPRPAKIDTDIYDSYLGDYSYFGNVQATLLREGDRLVVHNRTGSSEVLPENASTFFYPGGGPARLIFQHDGSGKVIGLIYRDDRHEEIWLKTR